MLIRVLDVFGIKSSNNLGVNQFKWLYKTYGLAYTTDFFKLWPQKFSL